MSADPRLFNLCHISILLTYSHLCLQKSLGNYDNLVRVWSFTVACRKKKVRASNRARVGVVSGMETNKLIPEDNIYNIGAMKENAWKKRKYENGV